MMQLAGWVGEWLDQWTQRRDEIGAWPFTGRLRDERRKQRRKERVMRVAAFRGIRENRSAWSLAFILAALIVYAAPAAAQEQGANALPSVELPPELQRVLTDYESAWIARDAAGLAALFAPDGFVMAEGMPPRRGRSAIEEYYTGRGGPLSLRAIAYAAEGDVGWIIGGYSAAKGMPDGGKFSLTLHRSENGRWLIVTDMDNGNQ